MVLEKTHRLVLHNDNENSYLYVMACLVKVCGHDSVIAEQCALITHNVGKCHIKSGDFLNMFEPYPGRTTFTKLSEQANGATSALGRALGYMGFGIDKSIASSNEVLGRQQAAEDTDRTKVVSIARPTPVLDGPRSKEIGEVPTVKYEIEPVDVNGERKYKLVVTGFQNPIRLTYIVVSENYV